MRRHSRFAVIGLFLALVCGLNGQQKIVWSSQEQPVLEQLRKLRSVPDDQRGEITRKLAAQIRALPATPNKLRLASGLVNLSTEGDFGQDTLQQVADTLAAALKEQSQADQKGQPAGEYVDLARLGKYEHVKVTLDAPQIAAAMSKFEADDQRRQAADIELTDLQGKTWRLRDLRGKVVLVNFWATWCPPCRKEMPDLEKLYSRFKNQGLVVLAISDEETAKVSAFEKEHAYSYPILLDPGRKVNDTFQVEGIPKSFLYDRKGKLVAEAIDMRTQKQFLAMLHEAGLD